MECKNCKNYEGDCGYHFKDSNKHTNFDIPSEGACDRFGNCMFYTENRSEIQIALEYIEQADIRPSTRALLIHIIEEWMERHDE